MPCFHPTQWKDCQKVQPGLIICLFCLGNNMLSSCHWKNQLCANVVSPWSFTRCFKNWCHLHPPPQHIASLSEASHHYPFSFHSHHQPPPHPQAFSKGREDSQAPCLLESGKCICVIKCVHHRARKDWTYEENCC